MTDTEILDQVIATLKWHVQHMMPMSPMAARRELQDIHNDRYPLREVDTYTNGTSFTDRTVSDLYKTPGPYQDITRDTQRFWRCANQA